MAIRVQYEVSLLLASPDRRYIYINIEDQETKVFNDCYESGRKCQKVTTL